FDSEDERSRTEWETLARAWEASTVRADLVYMHCQVLKKNGVSRLQETPPVFRRSRLLYDYHRNTNVLGATAEHEPIDTAGDARRIETDAAFSAKRTCNVQHLAATCIEQHKICRGSRVDVCHDCCFA